MSRRKTTARDVQKLKKQSIEDKTCPVCGRTLYLEPMLYGGTVFQDTSGWACLDCQWHEGQ